MLVIENYSLFGASNTKILKREMRLHRATSVESKTELSFN